MNAKSTTREFTAGTTTSLDNHHGWRLAGGWAAMKPSSLLAQWNRHFKALWRRHQHQRIQQAIRTYSFEKHCLTGGFRPAAALSTVRQAIGEIERNKLPLNVEWTGPWQVRPSTPGPADKAEESPSDKA